ncbi:hypothetical protein [Wolbachia pipientis]|uniref:hypothetical protein n=1 Tax=Wolbachia pipientis TaxID=955 RepID=UPI0025A3873E|nr:hypothetical protein [Wolbachia pipientis]MDM8335337.1 hypothetical protein [Wolbachia pipientis]
MEGIGGTPILDGTTPLGRTTSSSGTTSSGGLRPCGSGSGSGDSSNQNQPIECSISDNKITENDPCFQKLVREIMSKPFFEIPENDNEPLSWDW